MMNHQFRRTKMPNAKDYALQHPQKRSAYKNDIEWHMALTDAFRGRDERIGCIICGISLLFAGKCV